MGKSKEEKSKKTVGDYIRIVVMILALGVFLYSGIKLGMIFLEYKKGTDEYKELTQYVNLTPAQTQIQTEGEEDNFADPVVDFASLKSINPDIIGWLDVEAIDIINYPIVQGNDNDQYLHSTFEGTKNGAGSIFVDYTNKGDFTDSNTFIYGHNMKNNSMFGALKEFHKKETFENSPYIWIYTPESTKKYQIFSYHVTKVESESFQNQFDSPEDFQEYINTITRSSEHRADIQVSSEDKIITLSTCTNDDTTRFLVHAKLIEEQPVRGN